MKLFPQVHEFPPEQVILVFEAQYVLYNLFQLFLSLPNDSGL